MNDLDDTTSVQYEGVDFVLKGNEKKKLLRITVGDDIYMSGQEWYDRFVDELRNIGSAKDRGSAVPTKEAIYQAVFKAAGKAAGIE